MRIIYEVKKTKNFGRFIFSNFKIGNTLETISNLIALKKKKSKTLHNLRKK